jgi:hypothetical protein
VIEKRMSLPEDRIGVRKRITIKTSTEGYVTGEFWIERARPSGSTIGDALVDIETEIDVALERFRKESGRQAFSTTPSQSSTPQQAKPVVSQQPSQSEKPKPGVDQAELDKLEWRLYKPPHRAGWTFADRAPKSLVDLLEKGSVTIGEFSYKLSGPAEQPKLFVARSPIKDS